MSVYVTSTSRADHPSSLKGRKTNTVQAGCPPPFPWRTRLTDEWMNKQSCWMRHETLLSSWLGEWMTTELFTNRWMKEEGRQRYGPRETGRSTYDGRVGYRMRSCGWQSCGWKGAGGGEHEARWMDERKYDGGQRFGREKRGSELWWRWQVQEEIIWMIIVERQ